MPLDRAVVGLLLLSACAHSEPAPIRSPVEPRPSATEVERLRVQREVDDQQRAGEEQRQRKALAAAEEDRATEERRRQERERDAERVKAQEQERLRTIEEVQAADDRDRARGNVSAGHCCDGTVYAASCKGKNCCAGHGGYCKEKPRPVGD